MAFLNIMLIFCDFYVLLVKKASNSSFDGSIEFGMLSLINSHILFVYLGFRMNFEGPLDDFLFG